MKHAFLLLIIFPGCLKICAQRNNTIPGVYSLEGVMETASGFKLNPDSTFEFYYSYGALDRYGSGRWRVNGDSVIFDSKPFPGKDFKIADSSVHKNKYTTIKIGDRYRAFYRFVYGVFKTPEKDTLLNADSDGIIILPHKADTINLLFELSSERLSRFVTNNKYDTYTVEIEPWALEVFFKKFGLRYVLGHLEGKHPLLEDKKYLYQRDE